jgi:hypothetical protein
MPNEYSNFSTPDASRPGGGYNDPSNPNRGGGDAGQVWNPTGGPNGTGAWEKPGAAPAAAAPRRQFTPGAWGGQGNDLHTDGTEVAGTSGAARDSNRYREMGQKPLYGTGPQIDRSQSNESRGISMGALGLLGQTAAGTQPSAAERLGTQMGQRAQNAQHSLGASVRGGAMARAAAGRNATMNAASIDAQTRQSNAATRAGEMAAGRDAYMAGATGQRGQDLGLAGAQAGLEQGQRSANDQREGYYEDLSQSTKNAEVGHQLGRTESDQNAANAQRAQGQAENAASAAQQQKMASMAVGGITGGVQGWAKSPGETQPAQKSSDPWDPSNYSGSDERMKKNVRAVGGADLKRQADAMLEKQSGQHAAQLRDGPATQKAADRSTDDTDAKDVEAIRGQRAPIERDDPYPKAEPRIDRENPYAHKSLFGDAPEGYAKSRKGKAGYMFGGAPEASYGSLRKGGGAPGSDDFARYGAPVDRKTMTSDPRAKRAAFIEGMGHANEAAESGKIGKLPGYMGDAAEGPKDNASVRSQPKHENSMPAARGKFERADRAPQDALNRVSEANYATAANEMATPGAAMIGYKRSAAEDGRQAGRSVTGNKPEDAPPAPAQPGVFSQLGGYASQARAMMSSDERSKEGAEDEGGMADAMRAMAPSSYAYKPGFAEEAGQTEGEKNVGPMAQNMAADPIASTAIVERPDGMLAIDKDKALKLALGSLSALQDQVDSLQKKRSA